MCLNKNMAQTPTTPRKGQRVIVYGAHISGGIPAGAFPFKGGTYATYIGTLKSRTPWTGTDRPPSEWIRGYHIFEGNTADRTFLRRGSYTWEAR